MTRPLTCEAVPDHHTREHFQPLLRVVRLLLLGLHKVCRFLVLWVRRLIAA